MKIAWLPALIFCATLALVAANLDLGPIIKIAQCRSSCLRHHMVDGNCLNINNINSRVYDCDLVIKNILHQIIFFSFFKILNYSKEFSASTHNQYMYEIITHDCRFQKNFKENNASYL